MANNVPSRYNIAEPPVASPATTVTVAVRFVFVADSLFVTTVPPTGVNASAVGAVGATVSITTAAFAPSDPAEPGLINVLFAVLPTASRIVPPLKASASTEWKSRSGERSPAWTVYRKLACDPDELTKVAARSVAPVSKSSDGTPPPVLTVITSSNVTNKSMTDPVL